MIKRWEKNDGTHSWFHVSYSAAFLLHGEAEDPGGQNVVKKSSHGRQEERRGKGGSGDKINTSEPSFK